MNTYCRPIGVTSTLWMAGLAIALLGGCGGEPDAPDTRPARTSVGGVVTYNGSPVEGATVTFRPTGTGGRGANGRTDATGAFSMGTFEATDGVVPGEYSVVVVKYEAAAAGAQVSEEDPNYEQPPDVEDAPGAARAADALPLSCGWPAAAGDDHS